jgi:hypothetical protein
MRRNPRGRFEMASITKFFDHDAYNEAADEFRRIRNNREHYRLRKFNFRMDEVRIAKLRGDRVRTWPVWFIEDYLAGGQEQVWGPEENYYEHGQAAAGFERS